MPRGGLTVARVTVAAGRRALRSERYSEGGLLGLGRIRKSLREGKAESNYQARSFSSWGSRAALDLNEGKDLKC